MDEIVNAGSEKDRTEVSNIKADTQLTKKPTSLVPAAVGPRNPTVLRDWKYPAALGYAIIILTFGVLGGWSAIAKLDSAVTAPGIVTEENSRKSIQHLEGGIVKAILVHEGQHVEAGQTLFQLDPTQAKASLDLQVDQLDTLVAQEARLIAERDHKDSITWPAELQARGEQPIVKQAILDQGKQFTDREASLRSQVSVLENKIDQFKTEIQGLQVQREATQKQLDYINQELNDLNYLLGQNLVQKSRVFALEREKSRLEGLIGQSIADEAKAQTGIGEANLTIQQVRNKFSEDVASSIADVRQKINDAREKIRVASDVFSRLDVTTPVAGTVQNLKIFTVGGVIRPGEVLLEVIPEHDRLIVQGHVSPQDIDRMWPGMQAEVRFTSFKASTLPIVTGRVESVSRDRITDEATKSAYFLAQVIVDDIPKALRDKLVAGMPAELLFPTGERTVLNYLVRPLEDRISGAMRER